jgi:hypothetical protein
MFNKKMVIGLVVLMMSSFSFADDILVMTQNGDADQEAISKKIQSIIEKKDTAGSNLENLKDALSERKFGLSMDNLEAKVCAGVRISISAEELKKVGGNIVNFEFTCYGESDQRECPTSLGDGPHAIAERLSVCVDAYTHSVVHN